ncbi:hypothetical protein D1AOALGA4SA_11615 [Olavius algarvensis Delta 1 endosymbiont]|nr:hypothetical protein D1AOALGA4SA_11615 [Olavius algarvensis Delta 1 endosymbiont]
MQEISFLDPKVLASISNLELRAKTAVEGFVAGLHKSPHRGFSVEFTDYRHYSRGDDIRHIDWKVYARTGEYFIKQYQDETNVRCHILLDCSASMGFGSDNMTKLEYARTLASALSYFMFGQKDAVGLTAFDDKIRQHLPSRYRRGHLMQILGTLARVGPGAGTHLARPISDLAFSLNRKSLAIVISDLLDDEASVARGLQHLRFKGNDVIVFHVMDDAELTFPFERISQFEDPESQATVTVAPQAVRESYLAELEKFCSFYRRKCRASGIDYCLLNTAEPLEVALSSYLSKRAKHY